MKEHRSFSKIVLLLLCCIGAAWLCAALLYNDNRPLERKTQAGQGGPAGSSGVSGYRETAVFSFNVPGARSIAVDAEGYIWIAGSGALVKHGPDSRRLLEIPLPEPAHAAAAGADGRIYVAFKRHIRVYGPLGRKISEWTGLGEKAYLTSLSVQHGLAAAADYGQRTVWCFDTGGRLRGRITGPEKTGFIMPSASFDAAVAESDRLWVVHPGQRKVQLYAIAGALLRSWGESTARMSGFCGCCNPAHIALLPDGAVVTSEKGIRRVKVYDRLGRLNSVVASSEKLGRGNSGFDIAVDSGGKIYILDTVKNIVRIFAG